MSVKPNLPCRELCLKLRKLDLSLNDIGDTGSSPKSGRVRIFEALVTDPIFHESMAYGTRTPEAQKRERKALGRCLSPGCERSRSVSARCGSSENWWTPQIIVSTSQCRLKIPRSHVQSDSQGRRADSVPTLYQFSCRPLLWCCTFLFGAPRHNVGGGRVGCS